MKGSFFTLKSIVSLLALLGMVVLFQNCGEGFQTTTKSSKLGLNSGEELSEEENSLPESPTCNSDQHLEGHVCVSNKKMCPVANGVAEESWTGTDYGPCTVVSCNIGYRNQSNTCVFSPSSCPIANGNGQLQENGSCSLVSCNANFHVSGNTCVANSQLCSVTNGAGIQTWDGTSFGNCMVTACDFGYAISGNSCVISEDGGGGSQSWQSRNTARLFISGHSLTDDPLADFVVDVAAKRGDSIAYNEQIVGGAPIRVRTRGFETTGWTGYTLGKNRNGSEGLNVISELRNPQTIGSGQRYDSLVLAENHNSISMIQWENTIGYLRHYHDRNIEGNTSSRTFFYNAWLDINKASPAQWIDYEKKATGAWECVTSKVNLSLEAAGRNDRILNMPAGAALANLIERILANQVPGITGDSQQKLNMIFSDNVHLTNLGVYYMSLVTYSTVYGKTPVGVTPPSGIASNTANEMQRIAWDFVSSYYRTTSGMRSMAECRTHVSQQLCPAYWSMKGETSQTAGCQSLFGSATNSPFRWPDSSFVPYPAP